MSAQDCSNKIHIPITGDSYEAVAYIAANYPYSDFSNYYYVDNTLQPSDYPDACSVAGGRLNSLLNYRMVLPLSSSYYSYNITALNWYDFVTNFQNLGLGITLTTPLSTVNGLIVSTINQPTLPYAEFTPCQCVAVNNINTVVPCPDASTNGINTTTFQGGYQLNTVYYQGDIVEYPITSGIYYWLTTYPHPNGQSWGNQTQNPINTGAWSECMQSMSTPPPLVNGPCQDYATNYTQAQQDACCGFCGTSPIPAWCAPYCGCCPPDYTYPASCNCPDIIVIMPGTAYEEVIYVQNSLATVFDPTNYYFKGQVFELDWSTQGANLITNQPWLSLQNLAPVSLTNPVPYIYDPTWSSGGLEGACATGCLRDPGPHCYVYLEQYSTFAVDTTGDGITDTPACLPWNSIASLTPFTNMVTCIPLHYEDITDGCQGYSPPASWTNNQFYTINTSNGNWEEWHGQMKQVERNFYCCLAQTNPPGPPSGKCMPRLTKEEFLMNVSQKPETRSDVFIERGKTSPFERTQRLAQIPTIGELELHGYGYYKIIEEKY